MSFANPGFLWALPVLAVPVLLHLMQRQVPRRLVFPAIRFIKKASDANQGRKRLKDLLTLLTRLLIMTALILFFAKPRIVEPATPGAADGGDRVLVVVDASASMAAGDLDAFVATVVNALEDAYPEARFAGIVSSNRVLKNISWTSSKNLLNQLRPITIEQVNGDHGAAISRSVEVIGPAQNTRCVVISDFQESDWSVQQLETLAKSSVLELKEMPTELGDNCAILSAEHALYKRKNQQILVVNARVKNFSVARKTVTVQVTQDNASAQKQVILEGGNVKLVAIEVPAGQDKKAVVKILEDDGFSADNTFVLWCGDAPPVHVALVLPERPDASLERFFLEKALTLKQSGRRSVVLKPGTTPLEELDVVIALDATPPDMAELKQWVETGRRFIYFAGPGALNTIGNLNLGGVLKSRALGLHGDRARLESIYIDEFKTSDSLLEPFKKSPADLNQFPVFRYVGFQLDQSADALIRLQNNKVLVFRERLGLGEVYACGIGMLPMWSEFPTSRSFVPVIRQLVEIPVATDRQFGIEALTVGDAVPQLLIDQGATAELTAEIGVYEVGGKPVVVNVDRRESSPQFLAIDAIAPASVSDDLPPDSTRAGVDMGKVTDLSVYMAALVLIGILLELIAANSQRLFSRG